MIRTLVYRDQRLAQSDPPPETLAALRADPGVILWIDLDRPTEAEVKLVLEELFKFHPLAVADCLRDNRHPKLELYDDHLALVMHAVDYRRGVELHVTELDLFLGKDFVVTYHSEELPPVSLAFDRLLKAAGSMVRGPDRIAHHVLDFLIEAYKPALEALRSQLEEMEEAALDRRRSLDIPQVIDVRKSLTALRQTTRSQRGIVAQLAEGKTRFFRPPLLPYLRDLQDELTRTEELAAAWAEQVILTFRIQLNKSSFQANQGIRVLTALTALTLPVLLVAGWYGMNFRHMGEVHARYAYLVAGGATAVGTLLMLLFLRRKRML